MQGDDAILLNDYDYGDETVDPGSLGGVPTTMPSNSWWQKPLEQVTTVIAARIAQSGGINPPATNQGGLNRQASTTPGAGSPKMTAAAIGQAMMKPGVLVGVLVGALALVGLLALARRR